jgi:hypothetical protein
MKQTAATSVSVDRVACECIAVRVRPINGVITARHDRALRRHGPRVSHGSILLIGEAGVVPVDQIGSRLRFGPPDD